MIAELKITFERLPDALLQIIQHSFPINNAAGLPAIINKSIFKNKNYDHCFVHGFEVPDATLLFLIVGNDLSVHVEIPFRNNQFVSHKTKVNSYSQNLMNALKNRKIEMKKIRKEVIISTEDSYILVGKIPNKNKEFLRTLTKDMYRLIILPIVVSLLTWLAFSFHWIDKIDKIVPTFVSGISAFVSIILWYLFSDFAVAKEKTFKFELINEDK
jgi:hypothetical protein